MQQLDLFQDRVFLLTRARDALANFELVQACREYADLLERYPGDELARSEARVAARLERRLSEQTAMCRDALATLLALESEVPRELEGAWHRRVAVAAEDLTGEGALVRGEPAGLHWLLGGELESAVQSLRATLVQDPAIGRARAYLGDVLFRLGEIPEARRQYLRAFLDAPESVAHDRVLDPEVAALPSGARYEYGVVGDPACWVASVGTIEGVFPLPSVLLPSFVEPFGVERAAAPGLKFYAALICERAARSLAERVAARAAMKELCPALLDAYLARMR